MNCSCRGSIWVSRIQVYFCSLSLYCTVIKISLSRFYPFVSKYSCLLSLKQNYSTFLLNPQECKTKEEVTVFSVFVHVLLFCMYLSSMTIDSEPLSSLLPSSFLNPFFSSIIQYCMSLYSTKDYFEDVGLLPCYYVGSGYFGYGDRKGFVSCSLLLVQTISSVSSSESFHLLAETGIVKTELRQSVWSNEVVSSVVPF